MKFASPDEQKELFRKHRKITAQHQAQRDQYDSVKIAVLSGVTTSPLAGILEAVLLESGLNPQIMEGDYNAYQFEARFSESLVAFDPDVVHLHTAIDNLTERPDTGASAEAVQQLVERFWREYQATIDALLTRTKAAIIVNNFELPNFRMNGNIEAVVDGGSIRFVNTLNERLANLARDNSRVVLNDVNYLAAKVGLENWRDDNSYIAFKQPFTSRGVTELARSIASLVRSLKGKSNKCLVLDLDNTLWGGIIGDDGVENVLIGMDSPKGEAYLAFHKAVRPLLSRGIAFAVCSKNNEDIARAGLRRAAMHLKEDDFHVVKINWRPKSENIQAIKTALNIGLDSIVFVDDSEFERSEVKFALPTLNVIDAPADPLAFIQALSNTYAFETISLSKEDLKRGESFKAMVEFAEMSETGSIDDFLRSLQMSCAIGPVTAESETRIHQLINKTNQFNLTTTRVTVGEVQDYAAKGIMLSASLKDRNTDYGIISALWGDIDGSEFKLINWVMSCRVFNRKLEHVFFYRLYEQLKNAGVKKISARYVQSEKNKAFHSLLEELGMTKIRQDGDTTEYECSIPSDSIQELAANEEFYA